MVSSGMAEIIFQILLFLEDVPFNIWPWLLLFTTPLLIFSAKPHDSVRWRQGRIFLCIAIGYVLINLTLHTHRALDWKEFEQCQAENPVSGENVHPKCEGIINIADGASNIFYLILGWIPAAAYAGFWEFWWRRKYAFIIRPIGKRYKGKWFSTALIVCSVPVVFLAVMVLILYIYNRIDCPPSVIKRGSCWITHNQ